MVQLATLNQQGLEHVRSCTIDIVRDTVQTSDISGQNRKMHSQLYTSFLRSVFLLSVVILLGVGSVHSATSSTFIEALSFRKTLRMQVTQKTSEVQNFTTSVQKQLTFSQTQLRAVLMSSKQPGVSEAAINKARTKSLKDLQFFMSTFKDSNFITMSTNLSLNALYKTATNSLTGLELTMSSSINPIPLTKPLVSGSLSYFNVNSTTVQFRSVKTETVKERVFMCSGDFFGIHIDPTTRVLYSWGTNTLGRAASGSKPSPVDIFLDHDEYIIQLACGSQHALVLTNKAIHGWGSNSNGEVGTGNTQAVPYPVKIASHSNTISFINAGPYNSVYIDKSGYAYIWGRGQECQLGSGSVVTSASSPIKLSNTLQFTKISFGKSHVIGRTRTGTMYYWGQRKAIDGIDTYSIPTSLYRYTYDKNGKVNGTFVVSVCYPTLLSSDFFSFFSANIVDFQCGDYSTLVLMDSGRVFGWGYNENGALGTDGTSILYPLAAVTTNLGSRKVVKIFHKNQQSFAITDDNTVFAWGHSKDYVCNIANGRLNGRYNCEWYSRHYCRDGCGNQTIPDTLPTPSFDYIHDIYILKESSILVFTSDRVMGFFAGGKFSAEFFSNGYTGYQNSYSIVHTFALDYMVPYEKLFPVYDTQAHRIVFTENYFLSFSPSNMDMVLVGKNDISATLGKTTLATFAAYSFHNTHDFLIDGAAYYFGGIVNNTVSSRIIVKTSWDSVQVFNQTLPYPVAGGMLAIVDDYLYIFGGLTDDRGTMIPTNKVMRCKLTNLLLWEVAPKVLPRAIYNGVAQVINDTIYLFGGRIAPRYSLNADILYASVVDLVWQNSYKTLPYHFSESNLFSDSTYLYMTGGYDPVYGQLKAIVRALKTNPLDWEDINQKLSMPSLGISSTMVLNNKVHLFSVDLPQNFLNTNPSVPITIHSIYFANQTKPYIGAASPKPLALQILDSAYTIGNSLRSCREYRDLVSATISDMYWIKPNDAIAKFKVYCEMSFLGGGWTLVSTRSSALTTVRSDVFKNDYSGKALNDDRWGALRDISGDLAWVGMSGNYSIASIVAVSSSSVNVCKPLTAIADPEIFRIDDDNISCNGGNYCSLGGTALGAAASVTNKCGAAANVFNPFKEYTFTSSNPVMEKANVFVR